MGILAALVERATSGGARSVDAAMVDGSAQLMSIFFGIDAMGGWGDRGTNLLDGGAHFYNVYETADGEYVSIASYEPKFYANLLAPPRRSTISTPPAQMDRTQWPALKQRFAADLPHRRRATSGSRSSRARGLLRAGAAHERGACASAQRRARDVRRGRRRAATGARAALRPHAERGPRAPVAAGADTDTALVDWGFTADGDRGAQEPRHARLTSVPPRSSGVARTWQERSRGATAANAAAPDRDEHRPGDVASSNGPASADRERGGDPDRAVHVGEHPAEHLGRDRSLQRGLQVDVDRRGAEAAHDLERDGEPRSRRRARSSASPAPTTTQPATNPATGATGNRPHGEQREPGDETGRDRAVQHADPDITGSELACEKRQRDIVARTVDRARRTRSRAPVRLGCAARYRKPARASASQRPSAAAVDRGPEPGSRKQQRDRRATNVATSTPSAVRTDATATITPPSTGPTMSAAWRAPPNHALAVTSRVVVDDARDRAPARDVGDRRRDRLDEDQDEQRRRGREPDDDHGAERRLRRPRIRRARAAVRCGRRRHR